MKRDNSGRFVKSKSKGGGKSWKNPTRKKVNPKTLKKVKADLRSYEKIHKEYFKEYKRLGGKKSNTAYMKNLNKFTFHTMDIFVFGDTSKYKTRGAALSAVKRAAKIDNKELNLIFTSIDNVTGYT